MGKQARIKKERRERRRNQMKTWLTPPVDAMRGSCADPNCLDPNCLDPRSLFAFVGHGEDGEQPFAVLQFTDSQGKAHLHINGEDYYDMDDELAADKVKDRFGAVVLPVLAAFLDSSTEERP